MAIEQIENLIRYVTNAEGKTTDVIVPIEIWQQLINSIIVIFQQEKVVVID